MAWRDDLRMASFRGVAFHVEDRDGEGGRRAVVHEYPLRDVGYAEDLGRRTRRFAINAYVVGPDYTVLRDRLIDALEAAGPGEYVDRYGRGALPVQVLSFRWRESDDRGGICSFTIEMVAAGERREPAASVDTRAGLVAAADTLDAATAAGVTSDFRGLRTADFVVAGARAVLADVAGRLAMLAGATGPAVASLAAAAADASVILSASLVTSRMTAAVAEVAAGLPLAKVEPVLAPVASYASALPPLAETTPSRARRNANIGVLSGLARRSAVTVMARSIAAADLAVELGSYDDVAVLRRRVVGHMDAEWLRTADAGDLGVSAAVRGLIGAVSRDLSARGQTLAPLTTSRAPALLPAVVLSHRFYGTVDRAAELRRRAPVPHPGFMPTVLQRLAR